MCLIHIYTRLSRMAIKCNPAARLYIVWKRLNISWHYTLIYCRTAHIIIGTWELKRTNRFICVIFIIVNY